MRPSGFLFTIRRINRNFAEDKSIKIHIIGAPGSGKSFLADNFSKQFDIPHYDLDDVQWDNATNDYGTKRNPQERDALLNQILEKDDWIIEGVYFAWCKQCFEDADKIYVLDVPQYKCIYRIVRRFIRRKLGIENGKKESLKSLIDLLKWTDKFQKVNLPKIRIFLESYSSKVIE